MVDQSGCNNSSVWGDFEGGTVGGKTYTWSTGEPTETVAQKVLITFNIPYTGTGGGYLTGVDIKQLPAATAIKVSLLERYAENGEYKETIVNEEGEVEFISVGEVSGNITDVYYTLQSTEYQNNVTGAIVTGKKELPERILRDKKDLLVNRKDFDVTGMMTNCNLSSFASHYTITYDDPHLSKVADYSDGIDTIYENLGPFERVVGWVYDIDTTKDGQELPPYVTVDFKNNASVPLLVSGRVWNPDQDNNEESIKDPKWDADLGTLINRKYATRTLLECSPDIGYDGDDYGDVDCTSDKVLKVKLDEKLRFENIRGCSKDKFLQVSKIWFIAAECDIIRAMPTTVKKAKEITAPPTLPDVKIFVSLTTMRPKFITLSRGEDYGIGYNAETGEICVQFVANTRQNEEDIQFGNDTPFYLDPNCRYVTDNNITGDDLTRTGTLFPAAGGKGYLVYQVWAQVELESPSITINAPSGDAAVYADYLSVGLQAIVVNDKPPPIAINGDIVDHTINYPDQNPTTVQDLEDTDYERKLKAIDYGEGVELTISSLNEDDTGDLSRRLHNLMEADTGIETVYTCGPTCRPQLGGRGNSGGIINNITYSYSDRGSYTISVTEGPMFIGGLSGITTGPHLKKTETVSEQGLVVGDWGDGTNFKVLVDGVGVREAINCSPDVIRTGDKVSVTIHNNPVEA